MSTEETVLVATVVHPERRFRIGQAKFDEANAAAEEAGRDSPFIVQEEGCEGLPTFEGRSKEEQDAETQRQAARQKEIDG